MLFKNTNVNERLGESTRTDYFTKSIAKSKSDYHYRHSRQRPGVEMFT